MVANHHYSRIDTMELKNKIFQKIGQQRGERYFDQLKNLFSLKISKGEFDKVCIRTIGKENVFLHNRLIRSVMKNTYLSSTSPEIRKTGKVETGSQKSCLQSLYGDALPQSPRRNRTPVHRNRRCTNRPSPLGPFGTSPNTITGKSPSIITEEAGVMMMRPPVQILSVESGEEVEQLADNSSPSVQSKVPVTAPLGLSINGGSTRKSLWNQHAGGHYCSSSPGSSGYLPDTQTLRDRLEKRLVGEGIGVSMDAANLINYSLDVFMKRLIGPCMKIAASHGGEKIGVSSNSQSISRMNGKTPLFYPQRSVSATVTDFRVAMETNPCILGADWPLQLEKICFRTSEQEVEVFSDSTRY